MKSLVTDIAPEKGNNCRILERNRPKLHSAISDGFDNHSGGVNEIALGLSNLEFNDNSQTDEDGRELIGRSCFILKCLQENISEISKDNILRNFVNKGARANWVDQKTAVIAFSSPRIAASSCQKRTHGYAYSLTNMNDYDGEDKEGVLFGNFISLYCA